MRQQFFMRAGDEKLVFNKQWPYQGFSVSQIALLSGPFTWTYFIHDFSTALHNTVYLGISPALSYPHTCQAVHSTVFSFAASSPVVVAAEPVFKPYFSLLNSSGTVGINYVQVIGLHTSSAPSTKCIYKYINLQLPFRSTAYGRVFTLVTPLHASEVLLCPRITQSP